MSAKTAVQKAVATGRAAQYKWIKPEVRALYPQQPLRLRSS